MKLNEMLKKVESEKMSKSEMFRKLYEENEMSISEISKKTGNVYSFVYSVIERHCDKNDIELRTKSQSNKNTKANKFRELYDEGLTIGEIAKETNSNYSYVWSVIDKYRKNK